MNTHRHMHMQMNIHIYIYIYIYTYICDHMCIYTWWIFQQTISDYWNASKTREFQRSRGPDLEKGPQKGRPFRVIDWDVIHHAVAH